MQCKKRCLLYPRKRTSHQLFDHLIRAGEQIVGNFKTEHLGGFEIDNGFELRRSLHWQVPWLRVLQDLVDKRSRAPVHVEKINAVGQQTSIGGEIGPSARWQSLFQ